MIYFEVRPVTRPVFPILPQQQQAPEKSNTSGDNRAEEELVMVTELITAGSIRE
jgi:hypothetical protein